MFLDLEKGGWNSSSSSVCVCVCVRARACVEGEEREQAMSTMLTKKKKNRKVKCNCRGDVDFGPESIWKDIYIYIYVLAWNAHGVFVGTLLEISSPLMSFENFNSFFYAIN